MMTFTRAEAVANGFRVDDTCYPWIAYKGPRFAPDETANCLTDYESQLYELLCWYKSKFPAFRSKPIGAPNSSARIEQDRHIEMENRANALIAHPPK